MSILKDLLAARGSVQEAATTITEAKHRSMDELLDLWQDQNNIHHFEGSRGVRALDKLARDLGYSGTDEFLMDNSGAIAAIFEWIKEFDAPEWIEKLEADLPPADHDDEDEDD
jgi:hypothetical protein